MALSEHIVAAISAADGAPSAIVAQKLYAHLSETDPELLDEWLHDNAVRFLTADITERRRSIRTREHIRARARAFGQAVDDGDLETLSLFRVEYVVSDDNHRKTVADMTGADHRFVAENYTRSGKYDLMQAAFHRAIAKKVGSRRTADVLTEAQYDALLQSKVRGVAA